MCQISENHIKSLSQKLSKNRHKISYLDYYKSDLTNYIYISFLSLVLCITKENTKIIKKIFCSLKVSRRKSMGCHKIRC